MAEDQPQIDKRNNLNHTVDYPVILDIQTVQQFPIFILYIIFMLLTHLQFYA